MDTSSKKYLHIMNTALELAILTGALVMFKVGKVTLPHIINQLQPLWIQLAAGTVAGAAFGLLCGNLVTKVKLFTPVLGLIKEMVIKYRLSVFDLAVISALAAICEELLFRGALQRLWGIWPVSVLFILLHGYFNIKEWRMMVYGVIMLVLSAGIGYSYKYLGLYAAVVFHFVFDLIALVMVRGFLLTEITNPKSQVPNQ